MKEICQSNASFVAWEYIKQKQSFTGVLLKPFSEKFRKIYRETLELESLLSNVIETEATRELVGVF